MTRRPFVVTGLGHSGTAWAAAALTALGLPCGHEATFQNVEPGPHRDGDASWLAAGWLDRIPVDTPVVHLVRDPVAVLRSIARTGFLSDGDGALDAPFARFVYERRPDLARPDEFDRQVAWVAGWDASVEARPVRIVVRLEDAGPAVVNEVVAYLGGEPRAWAEVGAVLDEIGRPNGHAPGGDDGWVTWDRIRAAPDGPAFEARACRYGYPPDT